MEIQYMASDLEIALNRLEQKVALNGQALTNNTRTLERLYELVAGNGDGRSLAVRTIAVEQKLEAQRAQIATLNTRMARLSEQQAAWKNRAIGISATVSLIWLTGLAIWNILVNP
jgi:inorganic triphosphatase YgiF